MAFNIDWDALRESQRERMTPEQRERADDRAAAESRFEETAVDITGFFARETITRAGPPAGLNRGGHLFSPRFTAVPVNPQKVTEKTWEAPVRMRIEDRQGSDGSRVETVRFIGAVTGHEAYTLDEEFCTRLAESEHAEFCICAGTPGRYDACHVMRSDVVSYLQERRPHLFPGSAPGRSF